MANVKEKTTEIVTVKGSGSQKKTGICQRFEYDS